MKKPSKVYQVVRYLLALILLFFGANMLFPFLPNTAEFPEVAMNFMMAMMSAGFIVPVIALFFIFCAVLLLLNKWVSFALLLLAPIFVFIILFHLFLNLSGIVPGLIIAAMMVYMAKQNWKSYKPLFE